MGHWRRSNAGLQRYPRIAMAVPVRISTVDPESDPNTGKPFFRSTEETTANLSHGGAYLRSWEPLEQGRRVVVAIDLPSGEELQLTGRVVWTRRELRRQIRDIESTGYGVEFLAGANHELDVLDRLIGYLKLKESPEARPAPDTSGPPTSRPETTTAAMARTAAHTTRP
jgi:hypothetical protein